jgi:hypothetical protein
METTPCTGSFSRDDEVMIDASSRRDKPVFFSWGTPLGFGSSGEPSGVSRRVVATRRLTPLGAEKVSGTEIPVVRVGMSVPDTCSSPGL